MQVQMEAPSYIKLFFTLFVIQTLYWALANVLNLKYHKDCIPLLKANNSLSELGPMLLIVLNIIFALTFFVCCLCGSNLAFEPGLRINTKADSILHYGHCSTVALRLQRNARYTKLGRCEASWGEPERDMTVSVLLGDSVCTETH